MHFPPEHVLKELREFDNLPETEESKEIKRKYLSDEIDRFEFYQLAVSYLNTTKEEKK